MVFQFFLIPVYVCAAASLGSKQASTWSSEIATQAH